MEAQAPFLRSEAGPTRRHEVGLFSNYNELLGSFAEFLAAGLKTGNAGIVITTELYHKKILSRLEAYGLDVDAAVRQGRYVALDNEESLSRYMVNDLPDSALFYKATDELIMKTAQAVSGEHTRIVACGLYDSSMGAGQRGGSDSAGAPVG